MMEDVTKWLRSPKGEKWSRTRSPETNATWAERGVFGSLKEDVERETFWTVTDNTMKVTFDQPPEIFL